LLALCALAPNSALAAGEAPLTSRAGPKWATPRHVLEKAVKKLEKAGKSRSKPGIQSIRTGD